jgi:hypothetical protein
MNALRPTHRFPIPSGAPRRRGLGLGLGIALALTPVLVSGCFDAPKLEDEWTRVDVQSWSVAPAQTLPGSTVQPITLSTDVTFRSLLTGYEVAELRASPTIAPGSEPVNPNAPRLPMAQAIDYVLANSVSLGRGTRAVTGWPHLIQHVDFSFAAGVPPSGTPGSLFLLCYLANGDKVERQDGTDTLIITPYPSGPYQILPIGMELAVGTPQP